MRMFRTFTGMDLVRRSLGPNGCGVKPRNQLVYASSTLISLVSTSQVAPDFLQFRPFGHRIGNFSQLCIVFTG